MRQKYPELANKSEWTPRMLYIHQRAMILGIIFGFIQGLGVAFLIYVGWRIFL